MKVHLTAFGGKLRSDILDMPDDIGPTIKMTLNMDSDHYFGEKGEEIVPNEPAWKVARFTRINKYVILDKGSAAVYVLTGVS